MARKTSALRTKLKELGISRQRLCEFRKLAAIPLPEFKKRIEDFKERGEKITFRKFIRIDELDNDKIIDIEFEKVKGGFHEKTFFDCPRLAVRHFLRHHETHQGANSGCRLRPISLNL